MCQLVVGGQGETRVSKGRIRTGDGGSIAGVVIDTLWASKTEICEDHVMR